MNPAIPIFLLFCILLFVMVCTLILCIIILLDVFIVLKFKREERAWDRKYIEDVWEWEYKKF